MRNAGRLPIAIVILANLLTNWPLGAFPTPSFMSLGEVPGWGIGVSGNGSVITGYLDRSNVHDAFRWTENTGVTELARIPGAESCEATRTSFNGSIVVGNCDAHAVRWSDGGGPSLLAPPSPSFVTSFAWDVSFEGNVIVGVSNHSTIWDLGDAFVWTEESGLNLLPDLEGNPRGSNAFGVSGNGRVVVGTAKSANAINGEAFYWSEETGMVGLGSLSSVEYGSGAYAVSTDGSVIVGYTHLSSHTVAFRWTADTGMVSLGDLPGSLIISGAFGVSADGNTIIGAGYTTEGEEAFIWTESAGMRRLEDVLVNDFDLDLNGWKLNVAFDVSADGSVITGFGIDPQGDGAAWRAVIPEPPVLSGLLLAFVFRRCRT